MRESRIRRDLFGGDPQPGRRASFGEAGSVSVSGCRRSMSPSMCGVAHVASPGVIRLEAATVMLQWATGGMAFCWFTTRRRQVGLGYGWLLRGTYATIALLGAVIGFAFDDQPVRDVAAVLTALACLVVLGISFAQRHAGVSGHRAAHDERSARVAAMTGIERGTTGDAADAPAGREFDPRLDLVPVLFGVIGLVAAGLADESSPALALARTLVGAAFLGAITDAMLLGHWYLVQPGLPRTLLHEIVDAVAWTWPFQVAVMLIPTGMVSVWTGTVDDGWNGMLGWFWAACAIATIVLVIVTKAALRERQYSAVMAATGLLYLAILTAFGTDIVARAVLSG